MENLRKNKFIRGFAILFGILVVIFVLIYLWFMFFHDHSEVEQIAQNSVTENPPPGAPGHQHGAGYAAWIAGKKSAQIEKMFTVIPVDLQDLVVVYHISIDPVAKGFKPKDLAKAAKKRKLRKQELFAVGDNHKVRSKINRDGSVDFVFESLDDLKFTTSYGNTYPGSDYTVYVVGPQLYYIAEEYGSGQPRYWELTSSGVRDLSVAIMDKLADYFASDIRFPFFTLDFYPEKIQFTEIRYCCERIYDTGNRDRGKYRKRIIFSLGLNVIEVAQIEVKESL